MPDLRTLLHEFADGADQWFDEGTTLEENYAFIQDFFEQENLETAEWDDFQELGRHIFALQEPQIAHGNAFGEPNHPLDHYRESFAYLARGDGSVPDRVDRLVSDPERSMDYVKGSTLGELAGMLFPEKYQMLNNRAVTAARAAGLDSPLGDSSTPGEELQAFADATEPVVEAYREVVGSRTDLPIRLEVDQFFNWIYQERRELLGEDPSPEMFPLDEELLGTAVEAVIRPAVEGGIFEEGGAEAYLHSEVLPSAKSHLTEEALAEEPAEAILGALDAHGNLLSWRELDDAKTLAEHADPEVLKVRIEDLLRGNDSLLVRIDRALEWGTASKQGDLNGTVASYLLAMDAPEKRAFCKPSVYRDAVEALLSTEEVVSPQQEAERIVHATDVYEAAHSRLSGKYDLTLRDLLQVHSLFFNLSHLTDSHPSWTELAAQGDEVHKHGDGVALFITVSEVTEDLFYPSDTFRSWLDRLRQKKNLILQGPPGVGKTFVSKRLAYALMEEKAEDRVQMVQLHQSYTYEDFIRGYRPEPDGGFRLRDGVFFRFCERAKDNPNRDYVFIIDEINRGNLSKIFGELMMLIEPDKRGPQHAVPLAYQRDGEDPFGHRFYVPENVHLVGMMNTADRSLAMVDYALRRRFAFVDMEPRFHSDRFRAFLRRQGADEALIDRIVARARSLNEAIAEDTNLGPGFKIGHSYFCPSDDEPPNEDWYEAVVKREVAPLLREYWFDDPETAEEHIESLRA